MSTSTSETTGQYRSPDLPADLGVWPELETTASNVSRLERDYKEDAAAEERARVAIQDEIASTRARITKAEARLFNSTAKG